MSFQGYEYTFSEIKEKLLYARGLNISFLRYKKSSIMPGF